MEESTHHTITEKSKPQNRIIKNLSTSNYIATCHLSALHITKFNSSQNTLDKWHLVYSTHTEKKHEETTLSRY